MKRAAADARTLSPTRSHRRSWTAVATAGVACSALLLGACGGGDDDDAEPTDTTEPTQETIDITPTVTEPPTTTSTTTTTTLPPLELVTEGASVVVANASGVDGAAGRMTDALATVGFSTGDATNSSEDQLNVSKVYFDPADENAQAVANSVRDALGGGDIEVIELTVPAPTQSGELGDATVLVAMGNDTADKTLDELQGRVPAAESSEEATGDESSGESSSEDSGGEGSDETSSGEGSADG